MTRLLIRLALVATVGIAPARVLAQRGAAPAKTPVLIGTWTGTATVPLKDSAVVVPVVYTFVESPTGVGGTAMVPGQGQGTISNVTQDARKLRFRVTVIQGTPPQTSLLEHDLEFTAENVIEGMINLDNKPIAKLKVTAKK